MKLKITNREDQEKEQIDQWRKMTGEERLDEVEKLRIQAGEFLYEYPSRLQRVVKITRREER